ncbi:MAG TPA: aminotransferase class I/II-fold pyridoxal phosphate-dependent enzyme [Pseudosphingobacterium sp.]|nr:aminotransferase class I/II-fold pyridoxal phosphate-dependent enzyme [Pseudosphingobacterium sp.]
MIEINTLMETMVRQREMIGSSRQLVLHPNLIDFSSNDYFGWARSSEMKAYLQSITSENTHLTVGATGSRLLTGNSELALEVEDEIAQYHEAESALLMSSGYLANQGLLSALGTKGSNIIRDEYAHASLIDGCRLSFARHLHFKHNDLTDLEFKLAQCKGLCYVVVESLYSMDGDFAPLTELVYLCKQKGALLIVDEAHALGVYGAGLVQSQCLQGSVFARIITFGKALGGQGAAILGSYHLKKFLINFCRPLIFSTAMSCPQLFVIKAGYYLLKKDRKIAGVLQQKCALFAKEMKLVQRNTLFSPIQAIKIAGNVAVDHAATVLIKAGFDVRPIKSPSVPKGGERLRICIHAFNTDEEIIDLTRLLQSIL